MRNTKPTFAILATSAAQLAVATALTGCVSDYSFNQVQGDRLAQSDGSADTSVQVGASPTPKSAPTLAPAIPPIAKVPPGIAPLPSPSVRFPVDPPVSPPPAVCDPFSGGKASTARSGLRADLYYQPGVANASQGFGKLDSYFKDGVKTHSAIYLNEVNVPTRRFEQGFQLADGSFISNDSGEKLFEYFALRVQGQLGLPASATATKTYQFALLSDDGARLLIQRPGQAAPSMFIDNDDGHASRLACSTETVTLAPGQKLNLGIDYFQGPREHIALMLMWREVKRGVGTLDPLCGASGNSEFFNPDVVPSAPQHSWTDFLSRGWSVVPADSYLLPATEVDNPCASNGTGT